MGIIFCIPGLVFERTPNASTEPILYVKFKDASGKTCRTRIGRITEVSIAEARKAAKQLKVAIAAGNNPSIAAQREIPTLAEFFEQQYKPHFEPRKRSWRNDQQMFDTHIRNRFGHLRLNKITRSAIEQFHTDLQASGLKPATADHYIKLCRQILNMALDRDIIEKNPAARVKLFLAENKIEFYLDDEQLQRLLEVLRTDRNRTVANVILFLLATGARLNEALQAEWQHIDRANKVWKIPATNSKSKRTRTVPLNTAALSVLDSLDTKGKHQHLFVNWKTKKRYTNINKAWDRIRKEAGFPHCRLHDLRHSHASMLVNSGRSLYVVQTILGHSDPSVTQRYAHLAQAALQDASTAVADRLRSAMPSPEPDPEKPTATVIKLSRK